jgi:hypothetical protein
MPKSWKVCQVEVQKSRSKVKLSQKVYEVCLSFSSVQIINKFLSKNVKFQSFFKVLN